MKTFEDLEFKPWKDWCTPVLRELYTEKYKDCTRAMMVFPNGFGINVLFGKCFKSNGVDTYDCMVIKDHSACYVNLKGLKDGIAGNLVKEGVTALMKRIQELPSNYNNLSY